MADPNTQIDWWIAQTWQEAQGGAGSDALVAWLHENGLTAVSSYTILQAALSCSSEEAKQMVFGHPVWAGAEADADLSGAEYTSDTLEPEPEPDATFGLDDWADEMEEDEPVYGEPGYQPPPTATPTRPAPVDGETPAPRNMLLDAYSEIEQEDAAGVPDDTLPPEESGDEQDSPFSAVAEEPEAADPAAFENEEPEPLADYGAAVAVSSETDEFEDDEPEIDADQVFDMDPAWTPDSEAPEQAPIASMVPATSPAPRAETMAPREMATTVLSSNAENAPISRPAAAPPILRMPPATPAERAATFAAAFGKKSSVTASATAQTAAQDEGPPLIDSGPATYAEAAPAPIGNEHPHPAQPVAPRLEPLVLEPLPEITTPQPVAPAEPLFTAASTREPAEAPPLFPPKQQQSVEADQASVPSGSAAPGDEREADGYEEGDKGLEFEADPYASEDSAALDEETTFSAEYPIEQPTDSDLPAFDDASAGSDDLAETVLPETENDQEATLPLEEDELPATDWEAELSAAESGFPEDDGESEPALPEVDDDAFASLTPSAESDEAAEADAGHPRKRLLLDPSEGDEQYPVSEENTEDMTEVAKKLGIDFRSADHTDAGVDLEMSKAARELGISFRDDDKSPDAPLPDDDETAQEAQKLGISFREENVSGNPPKPLLVKYLPMILGIIVIFFLLLLGATFAGPLIGWLKS